MSEFQKFTDITKQRYPGDRKHKSEDVPQIEKRTECPRQRKPFVIGNVINQICLKNDDNKE